MDFVFFFCRSYIPYVRLLLSAMNFVCVCSYVGMYACWCCCFAVYVTSYGFGITSTCIVLYCILRTVWILYRFILSCGTHKQDKCTHSRYIIIIIYVVFVYRRFYFGLFVAQKEVGNVCVGPMNGMDMKNKEHKTQLFSISFSNCYYKMLFMLCFFQLISLTYIVYLLVTVFCMQFFHKYIIIANFDIQQKNYSMQNHLFI